MKQTTVKVRQRIQHFVVMTVDGEEEEVFIPGTIEQARREIKKSGTMLEKDYIGEEFETYEMPFSEFMLNAKKVTEEEK